MSGLIWIQTDLHQMEFFKPLNLKKSADDKKHVKLPSMQREQTKVDSANLDNFSGLALEIIAFIALA